MPRINTGTVRILRNEAGERQWHAKFTLADGKRGEWVPIPGAEYPPIPLDDKAAANAYAAKIAPSVRAAGRSASGPLESVEKYAGRWLDDRDGRVNSIRDDRTRMRKHVLPSLGLLDARTFGRDDVERLRDELDEKITKRELAWKTVASVWTLVTSMCADLASAKKREFRLREDNPARDVKPPERGSRKAKQYLYPSEFLQFVTCGEVPLTLRRAVALAVYTFTRDGELRVLRWDHGDIDMVHGVLSITRAYNRNARKIESTKSGETRRFALEANLLPLMQVMHAEADGEGLVIKLGRERAMAERLRRFLKKAGVDRPELHESTSTRKALTWHDLRATGLTWMAVRGDDPLKIKQRAGHSTFSTTEGYIREAEAVREGFGEVFPPLPECLLGESPRIAPGRFKSRDRAKNKAVSAERAGFEPAAGF
jgi:integrase